MKAMDQDLYRKLMMEPSVLQGICQVASRKAEGEIRQEEIDSFRKRRGQQAINPSICITGQSHRPELRAKFVVDLSEFYGRLNLNPPPSYEEQREERVRHRADEIFQDYISRLDLSEELKKYYRVVKNNFLGKVFFNNGNH